MFWSLGRYLLLHNPHKIDMDHIDRRWIKNGGSSCFTACSVHRERSRRNKATLYSRDSMFSGESSRSSALAHLHPWPLRDTAREKVYRNIYFKSVFMSVNVSFFFFIYHDYKLLNHMCVESSVHTHTHQRINLTDYKS